MAYTIKQARPILLGYLGLTENNANYIPNTDNWGIRFTKDGLDCAIFMMPLGENTSSPKVYFDVRDSGAEKFVAAWKYAESKNLKFFCLGVKEVNTTYKDSIISIEADIKTVLKVSGLENGRRSGSGTQLNIPKTLILNGNITRKKSEKFDIFYAVINKTFIINYLETFDNRLFQFIAEPSNLSNEHGIDENANLPYNRIVFGAPGTGKSYKLNVEAIGAFPTVRDDFLVLKQAILKAKDDPDDKIIKALKLGLRYSAVVNKIFDNKTRTQEEIKAQFQLTENDFSDRQWQELVSVAKALSYKNSNFRSCIERVTFHPNYSYAQFVGTYKPVQNSEKGKEYEILYKYVPGPFMRIYCNAKRNPSSKFLLLIEEINRANVAAVFGDVFQLLDRKNGVSEYPIAASEDIKKYLKDNGIDDCEELRIPNNMYIWATMNSADQGVFPMDTAFKRRWEFEYIGIDDNADKVAEYEIPIGKQGDNAKWKVKWDVLRRAINDKLISLGINEDKLLGPFFLSKSILENALVDGMTFVKSFESKVLMYLFEDAARMKVRQLFKISSEKYIYSEVCREFEEKGIGIFDFKQAIEVTDITPSEG